MTKTRFFRAIASMIKVSH